jgi:hypothetical protein
MSLLESLGVVAPSGATGYVRCAPFLDQEWEVWAFEVKLDHWQRALYQALQYGAFAHRVAVVVPERWAHRFERQIQRFRTLKVGIIALDPDTGEVRSILRPRKRAPASRFHHLYVLGKLLAAADRKAPSPLPGDRPLP